MPRCGVFSDELWAVIEPVLPSDVGRRGKRWSDHRMILEGIAWRYRVGAPWRDLPAQFGPWQTVWKRHHRWSVDGTYAKIFLAVQESFGRFEPSWISRRVGGLRDLWDGGLLLSLAVKLFELNGWHVSDRGVEPAGVVPVDPAGDLPLDGGPAGPGRSAVVNGLGLEEPDGRLAERVVQRVADGTDRSGDPGLDQLSGERDRGVLRSGV